MHWCIHWSCQRARRCARRCRSKLTIHGRRVYLRIFHRIRLKVKATNMYKVVLLTTHVSVESVTCWNQIDVLKSNRPLNSHGNEVLWWNSCLNITMHVTTLAYCIWSTCNYQLDTYLRIRMYDSFVIYCVWLNRRLINTAHADYAIQLVHRFFLITHHVRVSNHWASVYSDRQGLNNWNSHFYIWP